MTLLDRLKQAEAAATPGPWHTHFTEHGGSGDFLGIAASDGTPVARGIFICATYNDKFIILLRNHAADLIRLVEAAHDAWYMDRDPQLKEALAPFLAEEDAR